jgi:hypothetical protein
MRKIRTESLGTLQEENIFLPELLTEKQVALYAGISLSFLRKSRLTGDIKGRTSAPPFCRVGKRIFYRRADLSHWIQTLKAQEASY